MADGPAQPPGKDDDPVPRLPRGRGLRLSRPEMVRIGGLAFLLVFLVIATRPCSNAVSQFVTGFGDKGSAAAQLPRPGTVDLPAPAAGSDRYEALRPGMTEAELKAAIERARARAAADSSAAPQTR